MIYEQDDNSPHKYMEKPTYGKYLFDIGAAEGFLSLELVDNFEKIFLFEADEEWLEALELTFSKYKDKVIIVNKFVSNKVDESNITIDEVVKRYSLDISNGMYFKMDVEGAEMLVLDGMKDTLKQASDVGGFVCTYHNYNDERDVYNELNKYKKFNMETTKGYMIPYYYEDMKAPYIRRGGIRFTT